MQISSFINASMAATPKRVLAAKHCSVFKACWASQGELEDFCRMSVTGFFLCLSDIIGDKKCQKLVRIQETIEANLDVKCEKGNV